MSFFELSSGVLIDFYCCFLLVGMIYLGLFFLWCLIAPFFRPRTIAAYCSRLFRGGLFLFILLIVGDVFGQIWGLIFRGWLYLSTDYCGIDFVPVFPITEGYINTPFGDEPHGLIGNTTILHLQLWWLLFALATWAVTILLYRRLMRRPGNSGGSPATLSPASVEG